MVATVNQPRIDLIFRAFSDLTRLRILNLLAPGELCVCDLVSVLGVRQPLASRHLAYLRKTGLVLARKDGLWIYYRLAPPRTAFHRALLQCLSTCGCDVPELARDTKRLKMNKHLRGCCT